MAVKLTKALIESSEPDEKKVSILFDSQVSGFGLAIFPSGQKSFVFQYRTAEGKQRRITIGKMSDSLTLDQARKRAIELHRTVLNGDDPLGEKQSRRAAISVDELLDAYLNSATFAEKAESTKTTDRGRIERHVRPLMGGKTADRVTREDALKMRQAITEGKTAGAVKTGKLRGMSRAKGGPGTADKSLLLLSAAYEWAISQKLLAENPCKGIDVAPSGVRETIMDDASAYARLFTTLAGMQEAHKIRPAAADAIRFIALTACRKGEAAGLLWKYVDVAAGRVVIPAKAHKTGRKTGKPRIMNLPAAALAIIQRQPAGEPDDYVFRPAKGSGCITLSRPWIEVHKAAGLPEGLGLHALRHSLASHLAMDGASSAELMAVLGHKQISTTLRYVHFAEQAKSALAERAASTALAGLADSLNQPKAEVVPLRSKG